MVRGQFVSFLTCWVQPAVPTQRNNQGASNGNNRIICFDIKYYFYDFVYTRQLIYEGLKFSVSISCFLLCLLTYILCLERMINFNNIVSIKYFTLSINQILFYMQFLRYSLQESNTFNNVVIYNQIIVQKYFTLTMYRK